MSIIEDRIRESIGVKQCLAESDEIKATIGKIAELIIQTYENNGKILLCGNGGSASDALHITGELVGRFQRERKAMAAVCLNADVTTMTAVANDYGYDDVFSRAVDGIMCRNDVLIGISTSGNSENVYKAVSSAKEIGGKTVAFLGESGGKIKDVADISLIIPSDNTARIQESHIMVGHIICELVEDEFAKRHT